MIRNCHIGIIAVSLRCPGDLTIAHREPAPLFPGLSGLEMAAFTVTPSVRATFFTHILDMFENCPRFTHE